MAGKPTVDELAMRLDRLCTIMEAQGDTTGTTQTVIHKTENMGFYGGIAVAGCVATVALMLAFIIIENRSYSHLDNQVDQMRAWIDVQGKEIAYLKAHDKKD